MLVCALTAVYAVSPVQKTEPTKQTVQALPVTDGLVPTKTVRSYTTSESTQTFTNESFVPKVLSIKSLDIRTNVEAVGKDDDGKMDVPKNAEQVGWYRYGAKAGGQGNVVLAGHLDDLNGPAIFADLPNIERGALIELKRGDDTASYRVTSVKQYRLAEVPLASLFTATQSYRLHLITCVGEYVKGEGYTERLVVTAEQVDKP